MLQKLILITAALCASSLFAQTRIVSHLTRPDGGFATRVQVFSDDVAETAISLTPFDEAGNEGPATQLTLANTETRELDVASLFPEMPDASHFTISGDEAVRVSVSYVAVAGEGSPAHVAEQVVAGNRFRIFAGNWTRVFDGIAVVNAGTAPATVQVTQRDSATGNAIRTRPAARLDPMAKGLYVIGGPGFGAFEDLPDTWFEVSSDQPIGLTALRGNLPGSEYLWAVTPEPWHPAVVKITDDNPGANAFTDPFSLGPDAADVNNMPQGEVFIAVGPDGRLVGCAKDYRYSPVTDTYYNNRVWNGIYFSRDGGSSWQNRMMLDSDPNQGIDAVTQASFGQPAGVEITLDHMTDPAVAIDRDGHIYTTGLVYSPRPGSPSIYHEPSAIHAARRDPDGNLVPETVHLMGLEDDETLFNDKNWIAVSTDTPTEETIVALAWRLFTAPQVEPGDPVPSRSFGGWISISGDGAATMSEPIRLPIPIEESVATQYYQPLIARDPITDHQMLYIFFRNFFNETETLEMELVRADLDGLAGTAQLEEHLSQPDNWEFLRDRLGGIFWWGKGGYGGGFRFSSFFMPAVDTETGHLYIASSVLDLESTGSRVIVAKSEDGGITWTAPRIVDYPGFGFQIMPSIAVAGGRVSLAWYDSRHAAGFEPGGIPTGIDVYYAELGTDLSPGRVIRLTTETQNALHPVFTRPTGSAKRTAFGYGPHEGGGWQKGPFLFEREKDSVDCDGYGFIGDYIGIAADAENAYAIWADLRDLDTESDICAGNDILGRRNQNVYFARIGK